MKPNSNIFYAYPPINNKNSVYSLVFDHKNRLWVGSWGEGMQRLNHPERIQQPDIISYPYKTHDFDTYYAWNQSYRKLPGVDYGKGFRGYGFKHQNI